MGILIGMDEAGYGPNLGPLVIAATVWETEGHPADVELWEAFADVVSPSPAPGDGRLHLADSKQVYSPATGLRRLEETVLAADGLRGNGAAAFQQFCQGLCPTHDASAEDCLRDADVPLPTVEANGEAVASAVERWRSRCSQAGVKLHAIQCDIIWPRRWNRELQSNGNKAASLTRLSLQLLRNVWESEDDAPTLIVADKHGGRNRYDLYLQEIADGEMIFRLRESADVSRYRIGRAELQFRKGGESHLPVALASMFAKYIRELSMELFNQYWAKHVPGLRPTKGYPTDAKRFYAEIAEAMASLGIAKCDVWRER